VPVFFCVFVIRSKGAAGDPLPKFPKGVQVEVSDRFQSRRYDLQKITRFCNPVAIANQFELSAFESKKAVELCIPSTKTLPSLGSPSCTRQCAVSRVKLGDSGNKVRRFSGFLLKTMHLHAEMGKYSANPYPTKSSG